MWSSSLGGSQVWHLELEMRITLPNCLGKQKINVVGFYQGKCVQWQMSVCPVRMTLSWLIFKPGHQPLIGQQWSRDPDTDLSLVERMKFKPQWTKNYPLSKHGENHSNAVHLPLILLSTCQIGIGQSFYRHQGIVGLTIYVIMPIKTSSGNVMTFLIQDHFLAPTGIRWVAISICICVCLFVMGNMYRVPNFH